MLITLTLDTTDARDRQILERILDEPKPEQQPAANTPAAPHIPAAVPPVVPAPVAAPPPVVPAAGPVVPAAPPQPAAAAPPQPTAPIPQPTYVDVPRAVLEQELIVASAKASAEKPQEFMALGAQLRESYGAPDSGSWTTEQLKEAITRTEALLTF